MVSLKSHCGFLAILEKKKKSIFLNVEGRHTNLIACIHFSFILMLFLQFYFRAHICLTIAECSGRVQGIEKP